MSGCIYTPRVLVTALLGAPTQANVRMCTKVPYRGYEISISMDSNHGDGDLIRSELRVFDAARRDVTVFVFPEHGNHPVPAFGHALKEAFDSIDELTCEPAY